MTETRILRYDDPEAAQYAARTISNGGIAIIPTETVYGMAVDPGHSEAMKLLYELKGREADKPLARFIADHGDIRRLDPVLPIQTRKCADRFFPGPLTMVIEEKNGIQTGFRMPDNRFSLELVTALGFSPGVTSTNMSGEEPLTSIEDIISLFTGRVGCIIDSGTISGTPSTVAEFGSGGIQILRKGDISESELRGGSEAVILFVCSGNICRSPAAEYFLRETLKQRFRTDTLASYGYRILSAGTYLFDGKQSPDEILQVMEENGIDMSAHRSSPLSEELLSQADIVFIMDKSHESYIRETHPKAEHKVRFLNPGGTVEDPYECSLPLIRKTLTQIKELILEASETL